MSGCLAGHIHIYADAWYEPNDFSAISGICFGFFSEEAPPELLEVYKHDWWQRNGLQELEMIAVSIAAHICGVVFFTHNDFVRSSILKANSANNVVDCLMKKMSLQENIGCQV